LDVRGVGAHDAPVTFPPRESSLPPHTLYQGSVALLVLIEFGAVSTSRYSGGSCHRSKWRGTRSCQVSSPALCPPRWRPLQHVGLSPGIEQVLRTPEGPVTGGGDRHRFESDRRLSWCSLERLSYLSVRHLRRSMRFRFASLVGLSVKKSWLRPARSLSVWMNPAACAAHHSVPRSFAFVVLTVASGSERVRGLFRT